MHLTSKWWESHSQCVQNSESNHQEPPYWLGQDSYWISVRIHVCRSSQQTNLRAGPTPLQTRARVFVPTGLHARNMPWPCHEFFLQSLNWDHCLWSHGKDMSNPSSGLVNWFDMRSCLWSDTIWNWHVQFGYSLSQKCRPPKKILINLVATFKQNKTGLWTKSPFHWARILPGVSKTAWLVGEIPRRHASIRVLRTHLKHLLPSQTCLATNLRILRSRTPILTDHHIHTKKKIISRIPGSKTSASVVAGKSQKTQTFFDLDTEWLQS